MSAVAASPPPDGAAAGALPAPADSPPRSSSSRPRGSGVSGLPPLSSPVAPPSVSGPSVSRYGFGSPCASADGRPNGRGPRPRRWGRRRSFMQLSCDEVNRAKRAVTLLTAERTVRMRRGARIRRSFPDEGPAWAARPIAPRAVPRTRDRRGWRDTTRFYAMSRVERARRGAGHVRSERVARCPPATSTDLRLLKTGGSAHEARLLQVACGAGRLTRVPATQGLGAAAGETRLRAADEQAERTTLGRSAARRPRRRTLRVSPFDANRASRRVPEGTPRVATRGGCAKFMPWYRRLSALGCGLSAVGCRLSAPPSGGPGDRSIMRG